MRREIALLVVLAATGCPTGRKLLPAGAACELDRACASKICKNNVCEAVCDGCSISGTCHPAGAQGPTSCEVCDPAESPFVWLPAPGCVTTLIGDGTPTGNDGPIDQATVSAPQALATGVDGRLYFSGGAPTGGEPMGRLRLWRGDKVLRVAGSTQGFRNGPVTGDPNEVALLHRIDSLALSANGSVFIAEGSIHRVRVFANNRVVTIAGNDTSGEDNGPPEQATFMAPFGVAVRSEFRLYVADRPAHRLREVNYAPGGEVTFLAGTGQSGNGTNADPLLASLNNPQAITVGPAPDFDIIFADTGNSRIKAIINDSGSNRLVLVTDGGEGAAVAGGAVRAQLNRPKGVAVAADRTIYVSDTDNHRIVKIVGFPDMLTAQASVVAGKSGLAPASGFADGPAEDARFNAPANIALSLSGKYLYVADKGNNRIRVIGL